MDAVLVDSNVLLDVATNDPAWGGWSAEALERAADEAILVIDPMVYAEVSIGFDAIEDLEAALPVDLYRREALPYEAGFLAGKCFLRYRRAGGQKRSPPRANRRALFSVPVTRARKRLRLAEPGAALLVAAVVSIVAIADVFAPSALPTLVLPIQLGLVTVAITSSVWAFVFLYLLANNDGRRFLVRSLPVQRANLTALEQPNTLTVATLVLAAVVFLPSATGVRASTILVGALASLLVSWGAGNSARYRMGALLLSEALFWIGVTLLGAAIVELSAPMLSTARNAAVIATAFLALYAVSIAAGTVRTANRWIRIRRQRTSRT